MNCFDHVEQSPTILSMVFDNVDRVACAAGVFQKTLELAVNEDKINLCHQGLALPVLAFHQVFR